MAKRTKSYGLNNPLQDVFPNPIVAKRAPTTNDTNFELGQVWVDQENAAIYSLGKVTKGSADWSFLGAGATDLDTLTGDTGGTLFPTAGNINILGGVGLTVEGSGSTLTIERDAAGGFPITQFVVGEVGEAGFQTIQAAIDAANGAGGNAIVYVQPGTYVEDLTLFSTVDIIGGVFSGPTITGTHTPPTSGSVSFKNCTLTSATDIFTSAAAGTTNITVEACVLTVTNGYVYDLLNWTGNLLIDDCGSTGGNDGVVNNTGGSFVKITDSTIGRGVSNVFTYSGGTLILEGVVLQCPITVGSGSTSIIRLGSALAETLTTTSDSLVTVTNSAFTTGGNIAISHGSSGTFSLSTSTINSSNDPAVGGAGAGTLTLTAVAFPGNKNLAATLTIDGGTTLSKAFDTANPPAGLTIFGTSIDAQGTNANVPISISSKGTGDITVEAATGSVNLKSASTAVDAVFLETTAGGVKIDSAEQISLDSGSSAFNAIAIQALSGAVDIDGNDQVNINSANGIVSLNSSATNLNSISVQTSAGGVDIDGEKVVSIKSASEGIDLDAAQQINIDSAQSAATAVVINASGPAGGVEISAGTNDVTIKSNLRLPDTGTHLEIDGGTPSDFIGQVNLVAGIATINNANIQANDRIFITRSGIGASVQLGFLETSIIPGVSFSIRSFLPIPVVFNGNDFSVVDYFIVRQI